MAKGTIQKPANVCQAFCFDLNKIAGIMFLLHDKYSFCAEGIWLNMESGFVGLAFTKDGVNVMEQLVRASNHNHLIGLALFSYRNSSRSFGLHFSGFHIAPLDTMNVEAFLIPVW